MHPQLLGQLHYLVVQVDNDDVGSNMDEAVESQVDVAAADDDDVAGYHLLHTVVEVDNSVDTDDMVGAADIVDTRLAVAVDHCFCMLLQ